MANRKRLFEVAPADFTQARDALVRELREQGKADEAKEVAALRKPPVALWIANQLARLSPRDVEALIEATARVRKAQFSGQGGDALRQAMRQQREALAKLAEVAARAAKNAESTVTLALQRRVINTVQAAASSEPDALREGRLLRELDPAGFEALLGATPPAAPAATKAPKADAQEERRRSAEEKGRKERVAKELRDAEQFAQRARAEAEKLEEQAALAEQSAKEARKRADEARRAATAAASRALELRRE